ncbi:hypothetical protein HY628_03060 [Candidatus Uhrbacteria bacterium]|nr:hypothetical protein [Candidatus Uhrbacteria bacterium]
MRYFIGILAVLLGFLMIWKSEWLLQQFGRISWAEEHLGGEGGTRLFFKLLGLAIIIFSFLYMGRFLEGILLWIFAPTLRG